MQGASPLAFPALNRLRHSQSLPSRCPAGACPVGRLPTLPSVCFFAPYPPNPLPLRGRGRPRLFHARGFAPCIPGIKPLAALTEPAKQVPSGGLPCLSPAYPAFRFPFSPYPPDPLPRRGRGGFLVYFAGGFAPGTPAPEPKRHRNRVANHAPGGGLARLVACQPCLLLSFSPLSPQPALAERSSPAGKGRIKVISCKGLRPLHPRG